MAEEKLDAGASRQTRESESHDNTARRQPWRPVRKLETPPPPPGYVYRWIREAILGQEDRNNVSYRLREGWELVRGTDLPAGWELPTKDAGRNAGIVHNDGLLLAKIPSETVDERRAYYESKTTEAREALDNNMFNEVQGNQRYVKYDPQRDTQVSFGKTKS